MMELEVMWVAELEGAVSLLPEEKLEITKSGHRGGGQSEGEEGQHGGAHL